MHSIFRRDESGRKQPREARKARNARKRIFRTRGNGFANSTTVRNRPFRSNESRRLPTTVINDQIYSDLNFRPGFLYDSIL